MPVQNIHRGDAENAEKKHSYFKHNAKYAYQMSHGWWQSHVLVILPYCFLRVLCGSAVNPVF